VCGPCEGVGGIATGNKNDQITLTTCSVVANKSGVDPATLKKPVWGTRWTAEDYNEILIGPKLDPFCFQVFPGNSSAGDLCYRHDYGKQTYDMDKAGALREDLTLDTKVGKVQSSVIHQGKNFWVVNKFPWYAAGIHQCVCTEAHEGADKSKPAVYPIQFNWTKQLFFVGREHIGVEYINQKFILDHWAFGPHHVWSDPYTGTILRLWQPFNGLQVFPNGTADGPIDEKLFAELPPLLCKKKGGAAFRIKCDDNGMPQTKKSLEAHKAKFHAMPKEAHTEDDMKRAVEVVPRAEYRGDTFSNMSMTLNKWLLSSVAVKPCDKFTAKELQELSAMLYLARNTKLDNVYQGVTDNRRLRGSLKDLKEKWAGLNKAVAAHEESDKLHTMQRDGHCHETVMWYVHHLSEDVKKVLAESGVEIPLLAYDNHLNTCDVNDADATKAKVCQHYQETVTCFSCHSNSRPSIH